MESVKVLQVVGFKNSGKTTLISRWVRLLKAHGFTVSVLKHHGHASSLALPDEQTDGVQFFESGADASLVSGAGTTQLLLNEEPDFAQLVKLATMNEPDVLLIEGFKQEHEKKVVLLRDEADWKSLQQLSHIQLVVSCDKLNLTTQKVNYLLSHQADEWFLQWIREDAHETI